MCRQIYTHPYVCTHIVLIKWVLNLPRQSWVCRAAGLETASLVPGRGVPQTLLRGGTRSPLGIWSPVPLLWALLWVVQPRQDWNPHFSLAAELPAYRLSREGGHIIPPCLTCTGVLGQPLGSRGIVALTLVVWGLNPYIVRVSELLQDKLQM